jgi:hypothetical protein
MALCPGCHDAAHLGIIPREDLTAVVCRRLSMTEEEIKEVTDYFRRLPKSPSQREFQAEMIGLRDKSRETILHELQRNGLYEPAT